jgi:hypothetical protein
MTEGDTRAAVPRAVPRGAVPRNGLPASAHA